MQDHLTLYGVGVLLGAVPMGTAYQGRDAERGIPSPRRHPEASQLHLWPYGQKGLPMFYVFFGMGQYHVVLINEDFEIIDENLQGLEAGPFTQRMSAEDWIKALPAE